MKVYTMWKQMSETNMNEQQYAAFWREYLDTEKEIYAQLLEEKSPVLSGTLEDLAKTYKVEPTVFAGFLDGINESLVTPIELEDLEESSSLDAQLDLQKLYSNMLRAKAKWLYELPAWDQHLSTDERAKLRADYHKENTLIKPKRPGRNEPCHCASGKKYKHCCMQKDQEQEQENN